MRSDPLPKRWFTWCGGCDKGSDPARAAPVFDITPVFDVMAALGREEALGQRQDQVAG